MPRSKADQLFAVRKALGLLTPAEIVSDSMATVSRALGRIGIKAEEATRAITHAMAAAPTFDPEREIPIPMHTNCRCVVATPTFLRIWLQDLTRRVSRVAVVKAG